MSGRVASLGLRFRELGQRREACHDAMIRVIGVAYARGDVTA